MGHPTNTQIKKAIDEGVAKILSELEVIKQQGRPAGLHIESGWTDKEGSWYEGGNPHKDDSQETYDPEVDDWDTDMEFNSSYMGISRITCNKRVCEKSHRIGEWNE